MLNLAMSLRPNHYVVVEVTPKRERVVFGYSLPLSKRAANSFAKQHVTGESRVIMRKTAVRSGLLPA